jgi:hypothetical protein
VYSLNKLLLIKVTHLSSILMSQISETLFLVSAMSLSNSYRLIRLQKLYNIGNYKSVRRLLIQNHYTGSSLFFKRILVFLSTISALDGGCKKQPLLLSTAIVHLDHTHCPATRTILRYPRHLPNRLYPASSQPKQVVK